MSSTLRLLGKGRSMVRRMGPVTPCGGPGTGAGVLLASALPGCRDEPEARGEPEASRAAARASRNVRSAERACCMAS